MLDGKMPRCGIFPSRIRPTENAALRHFPLGEPHMYRTSYVRARCSTENAALRHFPSRILLKLQIILSRNHRFACFLEAFWAAEDLSVSPRSLHFTQEMNTLKRRPKIKALAGTAHAQPSIFLLLPRLVRHAAISP